MNAVQFLSLAGTCLALVNGTDFWGTVSLIVLFRRKLFQISIADETGLYKSEYSKVTWSHHFADSERKDVYSYECYDCNHDDRNNKPCITCLDGHCDVLCDENILNSESPWVQFSPSSRYWDGRRYKTDGVARWSSTKTEDWTLTWMAEKYENTSRVPQEHDERNKEVSELKPVKKKLWIVLSSSQRTFHGLDRT